MVMFKITVSDIKEKELPELTDDFIKALGPYEGISALKEAARNDLSRKKENEAVTDLKNQIYEHFLKAARFTAPQGLVEEEIERLTEEARERLIKSNIPKDDIDKRIKEFDGKFKEEAVKRVKLYFILDEIAKPVFGE